MGLKAAITCLLVSIILLASGAAGYAERRVALVLGNGRYLNTATPTNPIHDADDVAEALKSILERNVAKRSMEMAMAQFGRQAKDTDAALAGYKLAMREQIAASPFSGALVFSFG
jgi:hypothetical protein